MPPNLKVKLQAHLRWGEEDKRLPSSNHTLILRYILISGYSNYILKSRKMIIIFFWIYSKYLVAKSSGFLRKNIIFSVTVVFVLYVLSYSQCVRIQPSSWNRLIWSYHQQTFVSHLEEDTDTRRNTCFRNCGCSWFKMLLRLQDEWHRCREWNWDFKPERTGLKPGCISSHWMSLDVFLTFWFSWIKSLEKLRFKWNNDFKSPNAMLGRT